ncbi:pyruvate dehydrogenase (acetyl-transferring) E1 component subunit alpha [candidate division KSB3 bacterium]|uniref:Pyruvate dehydrogenase E1 component subunit alpha n=1 Tax=candidate division KSB3 bacterium TaxID=2044937 RepID=A0A9D5Q7S4_9BACT|nr:pyruvate dehydrogenase (acetyl-transferring) E1 component subunit alpha [candidate division KSB3 bacterium]MBD3326607.1 pyruvate dehydrogenase (acetyl-transferring) E1 component subunit alpha [candidate division KSB3 bacterium]
MATSYDITKYDKEFLLKLLKEMLLIRRFEEKSAQMYGLQKIGGFCHLYIGQEAIAVGSIATLDLTKDYVLTGYRDHGHALACGMHPNVVMAELFGKVTGCSRGKGGSMHLFDAEKHFYGGNGIVGGQIPMATGVALKISYQQDQGVVLCYFGDGAIHQGAFHESLNLAKIWNLPIVYICENNQYGMGTAFHRVSSLQDFSIMGVSYGIPGKQVNGMDVLEVYEEVAQAVQHARDEGLPSFLELKTYRYRGHSMSDPAKYRTKEELEEHKQRDPILVLKANLMQEKLLTEEEFQAIDQDSKTASDEAVSFSEASEEPALETIYEDILAQ